MHVVVSCCFYEKHFFFIVIVIMDIVHEGDFVSTYTDACKS